MEHIGLVGERCCGCHACIQRCPAKAIVMKENEEGFFYPKVIVELCISCGVCNRACPISNVNIKSNEQSGYAVTIKNHNLLKKSSSGGAFAVLAQKVLENGGVVFGCAEEIPGEPYHRKISSIGELHLLQGSKYVESEMQCVYTEVKKDLDEGKKVLFSGTPCQVAGLRNYVGERDNLVCIDIICHGVPSRKLYKEHLKWIEKIRRGIVTKYEFRSKRKHRWSLTYFVEVQTRKRKKQYEAMASLDPYYSYFLKGYTYRESCYQCPYACSERTGDITLGDFWGIEKVEQRLFDLNGVSAVIVNSSKGKDIWNSVQEQVSAHSVDVDIICKYNGQLNYPCKRPEVRQTIYGELNNCGYPYIVKKYQNKKEQVIDYVKNKIPNEARQKMKEIVKRRRF